MRADAQSLTAYDERTELLSDFGPVAEGLVAELVRAAGIEPHSVIHRIKTKKSFSRKLSEKGASYESIEDIHDLLGVRVITYFPDEVDVLAKVIEDEFEIDKENSVDKRALLDPDRFGYLSVHYICSLNEDRAKLTEHKRFDGMKFEVQIRSVLQHAWAEIEHDRGYHTEGAVPREVRRRFSRLAGLLELADQEFVAIREEVDVYRKAVAEDPVTDNGIDQESLLAFIRSNDLVRAIDDYIAPRFAGMQDETPEYAGKLAGNLQKLGLASMGELATSLTRRAEVVKGFVDALRGGTGFDDVWAMRGITLFYLWCVMLAERLDRDQMIEALREGNIRREEAADRVLAAYAKAKDA